jgi:hypothetical protein
LYFIIVLIMLCLNLLNTWACILVVVAAADQSLAVPLVAVVVVVVVLDCRRMELVVAAAAVVVVLDRTMVVAAVALVVLADPKILAPLEIDCQIVAVEGVEATAAWVIPLPSLQTAVEVVEAAFLVIGFEKT